MTPVQKRYIQRAKVEPVYVFSVPGIRENARFGYGRFMNPKTWDTIKPYLEKVSITIVGCGQIREPNGAISSILEHREEWQTKKDV